MRDAFTDTGCMPDTGPLNWVRDFPGLRAIGLDTLVEGQGGGSMDKSTLDFLVTALGNAPEGPILVALHHRPFKSGVRFMDAIALDDPQSLGAIIGCSERDVRVVCGHIHHVQIASVGGAPAISAPAICSTFDIDFCADAPVGFMSKPGGFLLHDWEGEFRSIIVPLESGDGPFSF